MTKKVPNFSLCVASSVGNLIAFSIGIALSWPSPILPKLKANTADNPLGRPTTLLEESSIAALLPLGATLGPILSGLVVDKIGRKKTLLFLAACPLFLSSLAMAFGNFVGVFLFGRLTSGVAVGCVFSVLPMYLVEISENHNRGILSSLMATFASLGIVFTYSVGPLLSVQNFCLINTLPLVIFIPVFFLWNPESPAYLALINDQENCKTSLRKLRRKNSQEIQQEMAEISKTVLELAQNKGGFRDLWSIKVLRKSLIISVTLITLQQFTGITAVTSYMQSIFDASGSSLSPEISTVIIGTIQVLVTVVTSSLVDILGRRILLLFSTIGSGLSLLSLGIYFFLKSSNHSNVESIFWLPVVSLIGYTITFNIGLGSLPWTIMAEIFPPNVKSLAATITTIVCFAGNFTITLCFPSLSVFLGMAVTFWLFALGCLATTIFVYWVLPETKAKTLQEIHDLLE